MYLNSIIDTHGDLPSYFFTCNIETQGARHNRDTSDRKSAKNKYYENKIREPYATKSLYILQK